MPYQSLHTGQAIDEGISVNDSQNQRLTDLENSINLLQNKTIPISQGGTGATTVAQALINLGISHIYHGTEEPSPSLGNDGDLYVCYRE